MQFHLMVIDMEKNTHKIFQIHYQNQLRDSNKKYVSMALSLLMFLFSNIYL